MAIRNLLTRLECDRILNQNHHRMKIVVFFGSTGVSIEGFTLARQILLPLESLHQPLSVILFSR
jgi:hypothetical protein